MATGEYWAPIPESLPVGTATATDATHRHHVTGVRGAVYRLSALSSGYYRDGHVVELADGTHAYTWTDGASALRLASQDAPMTPTKRFLAHMASDIDKAREAVLADEARDDG